MIRFLGQQLECRDVRVANIRAEPPSHIPEYRFHKGMGIYWPEFMPEIECWNGLGPHSSGGTFSPSEVREQRCIECGAEWFLPFLARLKSGDLVPIEEIEACHVARFGKPMLRMDDPDKLLSDFYRHKGSGGSPESFFPCCRIVRTEWDEANKMWQIVK